VLLGPVQRQVEFRQPRRGELDGLSALQDCLDQLRAQEGETNESANVAPGNAVALGDHLERSQMVLAELTNAADGKGKLDISDERQTAEQLLDDNRLFRQTARSTGATAVASVLDDLERVLLEISHSPSEVSSDQLDELRQEIESRGLLFKVRVLGSQVREQESKPPEWRV